MSEALIQFENVVKKFGGTAVLDGLTFDVKKGEVLCVVGPSGTGKSVTLKHLVRLKVFKALFFQPVSQPFAVPAMYLRHFIPSLAK